MSVAFENRVFNRRSGLGGGRMGCTLVTGFLGSGKTTLLRHLLHHRGDLSLAVLVSEFADSDVDSLLLDSARLNSAFNLSTVSLTHGTLSHIILKPSPLSTTHRSYFLEFVCFVFVLLLFVVLGLPSSSSNIRLWLRCEWAVQRISPEDCR